MKVAIVLGTRPEIIKLAPIIRKIDSKNCSIIFTGQHYDNQMGLGFMRELDLPKPNYSLNITKSNPQLQISEIIAKLSKILIKEKPDTVMIQGDTNTVLAAGICSLKSNIPISHVESGLRSNDWRMPEEHNRIVVDHLSELLFAPTKTTKSNLQSEKVHGKIFVTGNTTFEVMRNFQDQIDESNILEELGLSAKDYILVTAHRTEQVDDPEIRTFIFDALGRLGKELNKKVIFPMHPRTASKLEDIKIPKDLIIISCW
jgi:UDP-N-acetylglucosamine 2-epimerase (non-hydrolysing)